MLEITADGDVTSGGRVSAATSNGAIVVIGDRFDDESPVFIGWIGLGANDAFTREMRAVQYGNPRELSLLTFGYGNAMLYDDLLRRLRKYRISERKWFVRGNAVNRVIEYLRGDLED